MKDVTLISCNYKTPMMIETMIKSFVYHHGKCENILIMENSPLSHVASENILLDNNIPYDLVSGRTHSQSLDKAFELCKTRYALVVDSDVVFNQNVKPYLDLLIETNTHLAGTVCGSRGGYNLYDRVHPWFMFIDVETIKAHGIKFHDQERIDRTESQGFYRNVPIQINNGNWYYDVGATFYEDVKNAGLHTADVPALENLYTHYEGSSWRSHHPAPSYQEACRQVHDYYARAVEPKYRDVDIKYNKKKILITALYSNVKGNGGGSGSFFNCLMNELGKTCDVCFTNSPSSHIDKTYDLIISSHDQLTQIAQNGSPIMHICHGVMNELEHPRPGADKYVSISHEVYANCEHMGYESTVIPQPIDIPTGDIPEINDTLQNILVIENAATKKHERVFSCLEKDYNVRYSNINLPISEQIKWADLVITLGRGALEAMSYGRNVLVADNRFYMQRYADGLITQDNVFEFATSNFSGRYARIQFDDEWILNEVKKYHKCHSDLRNYVKRHAVSEIVKRYFNLMGIN